MKRTAQSAYDDIGNTYQQVLTGGLYGNQQNLNYEIAESSYDVNPEYAEMDRAYSAQEQEKAEMWEGYAQWRDEQPEYQKQPDIEPER